MKKLILVVILFFVASCSSLNVKESGVYIADFGEKASPRYTFTKFNNDKTLYWAISNDRSQYRTVELIGKKYKYRKTKIRKKNVIIFSPSQNFNGQNIHLRDFAIYFDQAWNIADKKYLFVEY